MLTQLRGRFKKKIKEQSKCAIYRCVEVHVGLSRHAEFGIIPVLLLLPVAQQTLVGQKSFLPWQPKSICLNTRVAAILLAD